MEIEVLIKKMKDIYSALIDFIEATDDSDAAYITLIGVLEKQEILENKDEVRLLFELISKIADNHHRGTDFFDKLEKIFQYLIKDIPSKISYFIPDYTKYNKRILFLLLDKRFVKPDETFLNKYLQSQKDVKISTSFGNKKETGMFQTYYLYPKVKEFLEEKIQKQIEEEILKKYSETISKFEEKCQIGENDSYICSLIRSDSVEEFIAYFNRNNLSLSSKIKQSIYETNSFLIDKEPTLIEYAAFFGSIQIIRYLKYNNVPLTSSLWLYTIHSNNAELVHFLEENDVKLGENSKGGYLKKSLDNAIIESIKCHHNDISNYIKDNLFNQIQINDQNHFYDNYNDTIIESLNFFLFPNEILSLISEPIKGKKLKLSQLCFFLTTITIPSSVTNILEGAFNKCSSLKKITIPSSVTKIGSSAFFNCSSLEQITISSSVTKIGNYAFRDCISLTQIEIPSSVTSFGDHIFDGIKSIEIKGDIIHIPINLFSECLTLTQITIPSSVTSIGDNAFNKCSSLTQITIPSSVTSIGDNAFNKCSSLTQITIPSSVTSIGNNAFYGCSKLTQITIPSSVTSIGNNAFYGCSKLTQITIPSSVTSIGDNAFNRCLSLTQITIPSSVTSIANNAFNGCSKLTQIAIPSSVTSIGNNAFDGCSLLTQITIPSSVTSIRDYAFYYCKSLTQITIPSSVTSFGYGAFEGCSSLTQIVILSSIPSIGWNTFSGCSSLTQITIPSSVTSIGNNAFYGCSSLTQITIPSSVTSIGNNAFNGCSRLTQITIPSFVTSIEDFAFSECSSLTQITIPSSVTSIGHHAFSYCRSLTQIAIPSSVTSIGDFAFSDCSTLTQITIPSSVTSIGDHAFWYCRSLTQIAIPSSVTSIGDNAFFGCSLLPAETKKSIINKNKNSMQNQVNNISNSKFTLNANSNNSNNNISLIHSNSPHKNNWSNLYKNSSSQKYTNNDKKSIWKTNNNNSVLEDKSNQKLTNEIEIIKILDHPNVLKAVDIIYDDKTAPSIKYEEWSTDIKHAIQNKMLSKVQLVYSIYQIAEGMKYIHSRKIVHLNLKPTNILISKDGTIKISDFKNVEKVESENETREIEDIFSFGEIVYFILSGREIINSEKNAVLESFSLLARQLIEACFYDDLERRPTFEMICDVFEQNNFNLISLSQQEIEDVLKLISQYRQNNIY